MRVEFWLDYICPISYKTHENLLKAIKELNIKDVEILYRSYRLESRMDSKDLKALWMFNCDDDFLNDVDILKKEYPEYNKLQYVDTELAHQLAHLAKKCSKQVEFNTRLLNAFFNEHLDISDEEVIKQIALSIGLSELNVEETIMNRPFKEAIHQNLENAILKKIDRVPHIRINGKLNLAGYQSYEDLLVHLYTQKEQNEHNYCHGGVCRRRITQS